ncbi:MAG: bifunctional phosphoserine phosphatase/homoserine phosphotransferase ThrH [Victivallales bacterium]|jgi:phosphoserine / homoserine phosphotransferase|nr:bifunctional phosphoserine phosphatase/homoserine phosphotransferase ThrH [Victivallales bacterium]
MSQRPILVAMDLEGVLIPEVWIAFSEATGIPELRLTTRDISDYDKLMQHRLGILKEHGLKLADIQRVIDGMGVMPGALEYMDWLNERYQSVILSDTFYEFAKPFMRKLGWPALFCNSLVVDDDGMVVDYKLRMPDGKRHATLSFKNLNFTVIAMGDSYNDTTMLKDADYGILFRPPQNVIDEFPQFPVATEYGTVQELIEEFAAK